MTGESPITANIDLAAGGKQFGRLAVPQSTNSSGWAKYYIPIVSIANGDGPTALLCGGNHGDEFEGPVTLMNLARCLQPEDIQGRIIIVPMLNRPAVLSGTRLSPVDGCNMNRAFPGSPHDSITGQIAHYVSSTLLPPADLVVDIHSGGSSTLFLPSVNMHEVADREQMEKMHKESWKKCRTLVPKQGKCMETNPSTHGGSTCSARVSILIQHVLGGHSHRGGVDQWPL